MYLDRDKFKNMMGFVDTSSSILILNRVYDSIAVRPEGITFYEFVNYLNVLLHGNQEEKIELCFKLIDTKKNNLLCLDDFKTLIGSAMITNQQYGAKPEIQYKADLTANLIFQKFGKTPGDTVTLGEFTVALKEDPSLLDIFTLLSKGVTENLITTSEEETRLKWYLNQGKFIVVCIKAIIRELESPTKYIGQQNQAMFSPITPTKGVLHATSHIEEAKLSMTKYHSDFGKDPSKLPVSDHRITVRKKSPEQHQRSDDRKNSRQMEVVIGDEVAEKIDNFISKDGEAINTSLMNRDSYQTSNNKSRLSKLGERSTDPLPQLQLPFKHVNGLNASSKNIITPMFVVEKPRRESHEFSFGFIQPSDGRLFSSKIIKDDIMPEVPEEGSILSLRKDHVRDMILPANQSFVQLNQKLELLSSHIADDNQPKNKRVNGNRFVHSEGKLDKEKLVTKNIQRLVTLGQIEEESVPILNNLPKAPTEKLHSLSNRKTHGRIAALKAELPNESFSSQNEMYLNSERGGKSILKKKMEEILRFSEEMVQRLNEEMIEKQNERQGELEKKRLKRTKVNIPAADTSIADGPLVFVFHEKWNLVINIMIGINKATRALWDIEEHTLTKADYKMRDKYELSYKRSISDNLDSRKTISFYSFAPYVFAEIRRFYKIESDSFLNSIGADSLINNLVRGEAKAYRELFSTGKSGSFFFYSIDGKYVIKTVRDDEYKFLMKILMNYHKHLIDNPKSLLPKFFGMHEIIHDKKGWRGCGCRPSQHLYLIIMDNIFVTDRNIQRRFDLKGSTFKRSVGVQNVQKYTENKMALKDLDFINLKIDVKVKIDVKKELQAIIDKDCEFFSKNAIIDYSLLIGIHQIEDATKHESSGNDEENSEETDDNPYFVSIPSQDNSQIYYFGIIDILTSYSTFKKTEHCIKRVFQGPGISCVPPKQYAIRFRDFMNSNVFT